MKYFLSFIEEFWDGQKPNSFIGRIEIYTGGEYDDEEIAIRTFDVAGIIKLRDKYDFEEVNKKTLEIIRKKVKQLNKNRIG